MPSTSARQKRTMAAAAHDPTFAKKVGIPQDVAEDFFNADQDEEENSNAGRRRSKIAKAINKVRNG